MIQLYQKVPLRGTTCNQMAHGLRKMQDRIQTTRIRLHSEPERVSESSIGILVLLHCELIYERILDDPKNGDVMRWLENGQFVYVAPEKKFPAHIVENMSTKSHQSLARRLYYFGFRKIGGAFHHESFIRGQPSSIGLNQEMSHSPARPSPLRNSASQRGPQYKVIKKGVQEKVFERCQ
jgi:hypothetical protein